MSYYFQKVPNTLDKSSINNCKMFCKNVVL